MSDFDERRRARAAWPIRRVSLGEEPLTDERLPDDVDARLAMVAKLTLAQWAFAGKPLPRYARHEMPTEIRRPKP